MHDCPPLLNLEEPKKQFALISMTAEIAFEGSSKLKGQIFDS